VFTSLSEIRHGFGWRKNHRPSDGIGRDLFQVRPATNQCIATAEVMLFRGHAGTNPKSTVACRPSPLSITLRGQLNLSFWFNTSRSPRGYAVCACNR
jgi:hypothetical protein